MNRNSRGLGVAIALSLLCIHLPEKSAQAQIGGTSSFQVLQAVSPARIASLGGNVIAIKDGDLQLGLHTPSLLDSTSAGQIALGFNRIFGEASLSHAAYGHQVDRLGTLSFGVTHLGYGTFEQTDEAGNRIGAFNAGETLLQLGWARQLDGRFSIGANLKYVISQLAEYNASAILADLSATYYNPEGQFTASIVMRNVGRSMSSYTPGIDLTLPFEIQAGFTKRLDKAPIRFGINYENMQIWRLSPDRTGQFITDPLTGEEIAVENEGFLQTFARHLVFHTELLLSENLHLRVGYNYNRRQELKIDTRPGAGGFTFGFGVKVSKFHLSYGRAAYSIAGATNHFSVSVRFEDFRKG